MTPRPELPPKLRENPKEEAAKNDKEVQRLHKEAKQAVDNGWKEFHKDLDYDSSKDSREKIFKLRLEKFEKAVKFFNEAIAKNPNADAYYGRGVMNSNIGYENMYLAPNLHRFQGDARVAYELGIKDLTQAAKLSDPKKYGAETNDFYQRCLCDRGEAFEKLGDYTKAANDWEEALKVAELYIVRSNDPAVGIAKALVPPVAVKVGLNLEHLYEKKLHEPKKAEDVKKRVKALSE